MEELLWTMETHFIGVAIVKKQVNFLIRLYL